jgi:hypothetical protein
VQLLRRIKRVRRHWTPGFRFQGIVTKQNRLAITLLIRHRPCAGGFQD